MSGRLERARLPVVLFPLVGREGLIEPVCTLLRREGVRLVTLTGPGGVGKTRLAIAVAERMSNDFPDGVSFVPLEAVRDPDLVIPAIASALGVRAEGGRPEAEALTAALSGRRLLVLDNLEQVLGAAPELADLLRQSPDLVLLATSRAVLRISGEWTIPVPPLILADQRQVSPAALLAVESVRLFVDRAQAVAPEFILTNDNAAVVVEICRRLDGLPLALELAAARLRHMAVGNLLAHLEQRLPLLTGGPRDQPARLRTMRDAIAWSYELLGPDEQALLRGVSVFAGGFTLDAVLAAAVNPDPPAMLDRLSTLVDSSLLRPEVDAPGRYRMLETIREDAFARLSETGEAAPAQQGHADWCIGLVEAAWPAFAARNDQEPWLERLALEHDNLRAALRWLIAERNAASAVRLAGGLFWFWFVRGHHAEGRRWLERALALPESVRDGAEDRARALLGAGVLAHFQGDDDAATPLVEAARAHAASSGFAFGQAAAPLTLGIIAEDRGAYREALPYLHEALAASRQSGNRANETLARYHLGVVTWGLGNPAGAAEHWDAALVGQREIGDRWGVANTLARLGLVLALRGELPRSAALLQESLQNRLSLGAPDDIASALANIATLAVAAGEPDVATRLLGAEAALRESIGSARKLPERAVYERAHAAARDALGESHYHEAFVTGRALPISDAVDLALRVFPDAPPSNQDAPAPGPRHGRLTRREREILRLVASGRTNPQIAGELFISAGTVRVHVSNLLAKLDARTRTEAVDLARRQGII